MIILDTHTLVWLDEGSDRLGKKALSQIDQALQSKQLFIASISFWEVAMLVEKGRLEITMAPDLWRRSLLNNGLQEIALSGSTAIKSAVLKNFHGDPTDRIIAATAIQSTTTLCTADKKILSWKQEELLTLDARK